MLTWAKSACSGKTLFVVFGMLVLLSLFLSVLAADSLFGTKENVCDKNDCDDVNTKTDGGISSGNLRKIHLNENYSGKSENENRDHNTSEQSKTDVVTTLENEINVIITFTNAKGNSNLQRKFGVTVSSMLSLASVPLAIYVIGDPDSQGIAKKILKESSQGIQYVDLDVDHLASELDYIVRPMQQHFSAKPGAYYHHALFFLSIAIHKVMPESLEKVIMLDADLKFKADIKELYSHFDLFKEESVLGIGRDLQPVYRHTFWKYRQEHPGTRVGAPPPDGLTGFNSGVLLLDLSRMRASHLYNSLITSNTLHLLTEEFHFKGHLGDQDFFTLLSMKHEELFYVLPCEWNRQLCVWWKDKGYEDVFDLYFNCDAEVKIYHGNCNTPIP